MGLQETFNIVVRHLRNQRKRCQDERHRCRYRWYDMKCAVGALIPDNLYSPKMEGAYADCGLVYSTLIDLGHDPAFCRQLQILHDECAPKKWEDRLHVIAQRFGLSMPDERAVEIKAVIGPIETVKPSPSMAQPETCIVS